MYKVPKYKRIITLGRQEAVDAIANTKHVMYKHGVWNGYELVATPNVIKSIMNSGYGADVYLDEDEMFYISIPCDSDMW